MLVTHIPEIGAENPNQKTGTTNRHERCLIHYSKPVPERFCTKLHVRLRRARNWYRFSGRLTSLWCRLLVHVWRVTRCHFERPWTIPNLVFKVTPFFDVEYLTNGYRYGRSYYRIRIGNRIQAFEWHHFRWPSATCKPDFKVTYCII